MPRRPVFQPQSLTSLIDVLFILVFASLVQTALSRKADEAAARAAAEADAAPPIVELDAGVVAVATPDAAPAPPPGHAALRAQALSELQARMAGRPAVVARISKDGVLTALELPDRVVSLGVSLIERVPDLDVVLSYLGDRIDEMQLCRIVTLRLGVADLSEHLVVFAPDVPLAELTVALVQGLRRDADRCLAAQHGPAVLVDPAAVTPPTPPTPPEVHQ